MCGILGARFLNKGHMHEGMAFIEQLLLQSEIRGRHATGVSYIRQPYEDFQLRTLKRTIPASEFIKEVRWQNLMANPPDSLIAHTRYSTSGDKDEVVNAQPLSNGNLALVHNGLVSQGTKEEFEKAYSIVCKSANDSEVILRKVQYAYDAESAAGQSDTSEYLTRAIVEGLNAIHEVEPPIFACGFLDGQGNIYAIRDHIRPLWFFYIKAWELVGFASTLDIIQRACKKVHISIDSEIVVWEAEPYTLYPVGPRIHKDALPLDFQYPKEFRFERPNLVYTRWLQNAQHTNKGKDLALDDDQTRDYRADLRTAFKHYAVAAISSWEIDPNYPLLNYIFRRFEFSKSQEYWACWLYGVFYHPGTVFFFMQEFPEFEKVDLGRLERWHAQHWQKLRYNTDRKYEKGHLVEMFISYREAMGGQHPEAQDNFFSPMLGEDPTDNFHTVFKRLSKLLRFGRYSTYIYTEALARCMGMPLQADTVFLKESASPRAGLCYATNRPDWAKAKLSPEQWATLETETLDLIEEIREDWPSVPIDMWLLESCLCAFKGFFRPTKGRYLGYYLDRQADEILQMENEPITLGVEWKVLWQFRRECLMHELLGEYANPPRLKVQKHLEHVMAQTGHMVGIWPMVKRGILTPDSVYPRKTV